MENKLCMGCMEYYSDKYDTCPYCGYVDGTPPVEAYHLTPGTVINGKYVVGKVLGYGGFGITYIGYDAVLNQRVAIKEYLPGEFSTRSAGTNDVTIFSGEKEEQFAGGIIKFIDEARRLAKFRDVSSIVKIHDSFQSNHTAYIVMEYLDGETLKEKLERDGKMPLDEALNLIHPVIEALKEVHKVGILHRDISPDNIFLTKNGEVKLLDFGAARYASTTHSRSLSVIVKAGYAPQEQYRSRGDQGTWTDVYACAATLYKMITGVTPEDSMERGNKDMLVPPSKLGIKIPKNKENAIMNALNLRIEDRTQTADALETDLFTKDDVKRHKVRIKAMDIGRWPLWLKITTGTATAAIVAFIILLITGVIKFDDMFHGDIGELKNGYVYAPNVINYDLAEADSIVSGKKLITQIVDKQNSDEIPKDLVMMQNIPSGEVVKEKTVLELVVSAGKEMVYMPDITGMSQEEAVAALTEMGFIVEIKEEKSETAPGHVTKQENEPDVEIEKGSIVTIYISIGNDAYDANKKTKVPNVVGKTYKAATKSMTDAKLYIYKSKTKYSDTVPKGSVISQDVKAGKKVAEGTKIGVVVSAGVRKSRVPDVQFKAKTEATSILEAAGFKVDIQYENSDTVRLDHIIRQSVAAGTEVDYGSTITIWASLGNPEATNEYNGTNEWQKPTTTDKKKDTEGKQKPGAAEASIATTEKQKPPKDQITTYEKPADKKVLVKNITLNNTSANIIVGKSVKLSATVSPSNASDKKVTWTSNNSSVATVDANGTVTGKKAGNATITVKSSDGTGITASCSITVEEPKPNIVLASSIKITASKNTIDTNETVTLRATVSPSNASNKSVSWGMYSTDGKQMIQNETSSSCTFTSTSAGTFGVYATADDGSGVMEIYYITVETPKVKVPDLVGLSRTEAESKLRAVGLVPGVVAYAHDESKSSNIVLSQGTNRGSELQQGDSVDIVVCDNTREYRYATITTQTTESQNSSLSGWTRTGSYVTFDGANWSSWSQTAVTSSETRKVETKTEVSDPLTPRGYTTPADNDIIEMGDRGDKVKWIQQFLINYFNDTTIFGSWGIDGIYGQKTDDVVWNFQYGEGLTADGSVGPQTIARMKLLCRQRKKNITYYRYKDGTRIYTYSKKVQGSWSSWSTTEPSGSNIVTEWRYKY